MHDQRRASAPNTVGHVAPCLQLCFTWAAENACCRRGGTAGGGDGGGILVEKKDGQNKLISCYLLSLESWFSFVTAATHRAVPGPYVFTTFWYLLQAVLPYVARPGQWVSHLGYSTEGTPTPVSGVLPGTGVIIRVDAFPFFCGWIRVRV